MSEQAAITPFLGLEEPDAPLIVFPIPYDLASSWQPGASRGPYALTEASQHLECLDPVLAVDLCRVGVATEQPLEVDISGPEAMHDKILATARELVSKERFLLSVGGDHSITPPLVATHLEVWPKLSVLYLDAHADFRTQFMGSTRSHACTARRLAELGMPLVMAGIRSVSLDELDAIPSYPTVSCFPHWIWKEHGRKLLAEVDRRLGKYVYLSLDLDLLDPSVACGVGNPEPGGPDFWWLVSLITMLCRKHVLVGADLVELAPTSGDKASAMVAARAAQLILSAAALSRGFTSPLPQW